MATMSFPGEQRAPGEGPALFQTRDDARQGGREDDVPIEGETVGAEVAAGADEQRRDVVDAADDAIGDRRDRADEDDEENRLLAQLEQEDGEREPRDRRHRLEAGDEGPDSRAQRPPAGRRDTEREADDRRDGESDEATRDRDRRRVPEGALGQLVGELAEGAARGGQDVFRLELQGDDELPEGEEEADRGELRPGPGPQARSPGRRGDGRVESVEALEFGGEGRLGVGDEGGCRGGISAGHGGPLPCAGPR